LIAEVAAGALVAFSGFGVLTTVAKEVPPTARAWLSVPIGAALYLLASLLLLVTTETLDPVLALGLVAGIGVVSLAWAVQHRRPTRRDLVAGGLSVAVAVLTVVVARTWHLTRLTPDSLRYLLAATDLVRHDAFAEIHRSDLLVRQIGLPALHTFYVHVGRDYVASISPLFGVFGLGLFTWLGWQLTEGPETRRWWLVAGAVVFLATSNRLVYDSFYINTHIQMAAFLLIAVAGAWLALNQERPGWALPAGLALAATLLMRPEAPLVVAVILVTVAAIRAGSAVRALMTLPSVVVISVWYGIVLWQHANLGDEISLAAPVFGSMVAVFGSALAVVVGGLDRWGGPASYFDRVAVIVLAGLLVIYGIRSPDLVTASAQATFRNLTYDGLWLATWVAVLALLAVALFVHRVPDGRLWTVPIVGFGLLFWLLPLIRGGAWRVGAGDSGNRILAHILPAAVLFLVVAAQSWNDSTGNSRQVG
jgi:hypothetical protein